jgi:hypothetical protein
VSTWPFVEPEFVGVIHSLKSKSVIFKTISVSHHDHISSRIQLSKPFRLFRIDDSVLLPHKHGEVCKSFKIRSLVLVSGFLFVIELRKENLMILIPLKTPPRAEIVSRSYYLLKEDPFSHITDCSVGHFAEELITFLIRRYSLQRSSESK